MDSNIILLDGAVYEDLFSDDVIKQIAVANVLVTKFTKKKSTAENYMKTSYRIPSEPVTPCNLSLLYE